MLALALLVAVAAAAASVPVARAAGIVFRYLPGDAALSSPVVADGLDVAPFVDARVAPARGPGGWGLAPRTSARFEAGATLRGTQAETLRQGLGPQLTAEAWFRADDAAARTVLLTNRVAGGDGFVLGLDGGRPYFVLHHDGAAYRVAADAALASDADTWLAATARRTGETLVVTLYVDGRRAARGAFGAAFPAVYEVARPFLVGSEAPAAADAPVNAFTGRLHGAIVRDYVAQDAYLTSGVPRDGSAYLGLPAFHDQDLTVFHVPMDARIDPSPTPLRDRFFLPFVNDNYVPQGTASRFDEEGDATTALVYVAYYHRTRDGRAESLPSVVAEIDAVTGALRRGFRLTGGNISTSHAGGVAYVDGALYLSSRGWLERYPLPPYDPAGPVFLDLPAEAEGTMRTGSKASFVSAHDDTLWVGDWRTASDVAPYLFGYPLGDDGRLVPGGRPAIYALPRNIQGVDLFDHGGQRYVFMSRNRNSREAEVLRFRRSQLSPYVVPTADTSITLPYGIEDLSFWPNGTLWTNSESGTDYYQNRETGAWSTFFPFVYSVAPDGLVPGLTSVSTEPAAGADVGLRLDLFPNPVAGPVTVSLGVDRPGPVRVTVVDVLGRRVATLHDGAAAPGERTFAWAGEGAAPGLYFVVAEAGGRRVVRALTRI